MKSLFSKAGQRRLHALALAQTLFAFDYDGTLAPIRPSADGAHIPSATTAALAQLCEKVSVAIISGREVADLKTRLGFKPRYLVGNHGAEGLPGGRARVQRAKKICERWSRQIQDFLDHHPLEGVSTEKKLCSITMHYRHASNRPDAKLSLARLAANLDPSPRRVGGKSVLNFVPEGLPHKGDALRALLVKSGLPYALYFGDDDTDEDVFRLHQKNILCVRVGHKLSSAADFFVERPSDVGRIVQDLVSSRAFKRHNARSKF